MKNKKNNYIVISIFIAFLVCVCWSIIGFTNNEVKAQNFTLTGKVNKETYILGEPIKIGFEFTNEAETPILIPSGGVEVGSLKIFITNKESEYKRYVGAGWGRKLGFPITLEPRKSHKYQEFVILWSNKPDVSGLSEYAAKRVLEGKITTDYAFPKLGVYFIKGLSYVGENATPIESEPIQIVINEPVGDDLKVWEQIKGNREIALLMQTGEFDTNKEEEKTQLISKVEQILEQYPNSIYSSYLRPNLEKFKTNEARRKEMLEKAKTKPGN